MTDRKDFIINDEEAYCIFHPTQKYFYKKFNQCYRCFKEGNIEQKTEKRNPVKEIKERYTK